MFEEICEIVPQIPKKKGGRGRPLNLTLRELYCMVVFFAAFPQTLRQLEAFTWLFLKKELDHTNWSRWMNKLDETIIEQATRKLNRRMTARRKVEYVADSTPLTLSFYRALMHGGEELLELVTWKLHVILAYLPVLGLLSVVSVHTTHGDAHDSPPYREYLLPKAEMRPGGRIHADSAYWAIENIRQTKEKKVTPNFVPREGADGGLTLQQALKEYDNEARKRFRGMVEGWFGGIATRQGTKCRFKKHQAKVIFCYALALAQQVRTYMRYKVLTFYLIFAPTPVSALYLLPCSPRHQMPVQAPLRPSDLQQKPAKSKPPPHPTAANTQTKRARTCPPQPHYYPTPNYLANRKSKPAFLKALATPAQL